MDTSTSLTDALTKTPSLMTGLLAQMGDLLDGDLTQNGLFSNLLNQTDPLQNSLTTLAQTPSALPSTTSNTNTLPSLTDTTSTTSGALLQNLTDLSATLRNVLNTLRQRDHQNQSTVNQGKTAPKTTTSTASSASPADSSSVSTSAPTTLAATATTPASSNTIPTTKASTPWTATKTTATKTTGAATTTTATQSTDATTANSDTTTDPLTDIVAELLMLTQLMMKNLQASKTTSGGTAATATTSATPAVGDATAAGTAGTTPGLTGAATDPMLQLLALLQDTAKQLLTGTGKNGTATKDAAATTTAATTVTAGTTLTAATDIAQQLAALDTGLKNILTALEQDTQTSAKPNASLVKAAADATADAAIATAALGDAVKPALSDDRQSPLFNMLGYTSTAAAAAPLATTTTTTTATPATPSATTVTASIAAAATEKSDNTAFNMGQNGNADTGANTGANPGNGNDAASALANARNGNLSAVEGAQATGTYNFASQLSALRATNGGATGLPTAVDQVILQMNRSVKNGNDQMSLQLQPGDLGKITVKLNFDSEGKVQGTVVADNPKTLDLLQKDSRSLERALQDAGLRADSGSLQFSLGGQSNQNNAGQNAASNGNKAQAGTDDASGMEGLALDAGALAETYYLTPSGVNIRV